MLNGKVVLITGGTGSFGNKFVGTVLEKYPGIKKIVIYSRSEKSQDKMKLKYPEREYKMLRYFIGDVRDADRLRRACEGIDVIIHAAEMGQIDTSEYNPQECINTNIIGTMNVVNAALDCGVQHVISLSSDKACAPSSLYGATKLAADKLIIAANNIRGSKNIRFSVVRYGNVLGSDGSVVTRFIRMSEEGALSLPITDKRMTRFVISQLESVEMVLWVLQHHLGGELFVPKIPSYRITDLATAIAPGLKQVEVGIRPGEKLHEEMITQTDAVRTIDLGKYFAILPIGEYNYTIDDYLNHHHAKLIQNNFCYSSENNKEWETVDSLRKKLKEQIPGFYVKWNLDEKNYDNA